MQGPALHNMPHTGEQVLRKLVKTGEADTAVRVYSCRLVYSMFGPAPGWFQAGLDTCTAAGLAPQLRGEDRAAAILLLGDKVVHEICYNIVIKSHGVSEVSF